MSHPVGTHISKSQDHELNYWLKKNDFGQTSDNRDTLCDLIDAAKDYYGKSDSEHLKHKELDTYFSDNSDSWSFES